MKVKKAILTGGGRATRLHPITTTINKHLIPLANKPMIFHAIEKAVEAGIEEIFINVNPGETELQKHIGDGGHWDIDIKFFEQTGGPQGIAHVVKEAEEFVKGEPFMFYLSDNVLPGGVKELVEEFNKGNHDCMLALSKVPDARQFGVPVMDEQGKLVDVLEKPTDPPHDLAVTGIYLYGPDVFFKAYDNIEKSARGEYEISDIHSYFLKNDHKVGHKEITGWWRDTGKPDDLLAANALLLDKLPDDYFVGSDLLPEAELSGKVRVDRGVVAKGKVKIIGPAIIGKNCQLEDCTIGPYATLGSGTAVKGASISNSLIFDNCQIDCATSIKDSIMGKKAKVVKKSDDGGEHRLVLGDNTLVEM